MKSVTESRRLSLLTTTLIATIDNENQSCKIYLSSIKENLFHFLAKSDLIASEPLNQSSRIHHTSIIISLILFITMNLVVD